MRILILCVGKRAPGWVEKGFEDYARRMPRECQLDLKTVAIDKTLGMENAERRRQREGERLTRAILKRGTVGALDVKGVLWNTVQLSEQLDRWLHSGRDVTLLVGGPDGLSTACLTQAEFRWSLSPLTFPHALVRVIVAEQLFRAWCILSGHPYHRE